MGQNHKHGVPQNWRLGNHPVAKAKVTPNFTKKTKLLPMTLSSTYKRSKTASIEERKARSSVLGDLFKEGLYIDSEYTSAPMVERVVVQMVIAHRDQHQWHLGHFDIRSEFLNEEHRFKSPVYANEMARANG